MASHLQNRVNMARRFIDFLDANLPADTDLATVETFTTDEWTQVAELAGENLPSPETRSAILVGLTERRRPLDARLLQGLPQ